MLSKRAIINEVIKEWSWLVPSGMPDATNPKHLEILRSVLFEEFNISKYETDQFIYNSCVPDKRLRPGGRNRSGSRSQ